jgi:hypothetical protein
MRTRWHCDLRALPLPYLKNLLAVHKDAVRPSPISVVARFASYADAMRGGHDASNLLPARLSSQIDELCISAGRFVLLPDYHAVLLRLVRAFHSFYIYRLLPVPGPLSAQPPGTGPKPPGTAPTPPPSAPPTTCTTSTSSTTGTARLVPSRAGVGESEVGPVGVGRACGAVAGVPNARDVTGVEHPGHREARSTTKAARVQADSWTTAGTNPT